jgi:hypothetical protein
LAGYVGDAFRRCGVATQVSTMNVRQLMVREYYSAIAAQTDLCSIEIPISQGIRDFFVWYNIKNMKDEAHGQ